MATKAHRSQPRLIVEAGVSDPLLPMRLRVPGHLARRFYRIHVAIMNEGLAAVGLNSASYGMLVTVNRLPGRTQRTVAIDRGLDPVTTGQIVDELERQGLVRRRAHPRDRRAWRIELTDSGRRTFARARSIARAAQERLVSSLSNDEVIKLRDLMARVIEAHASYDRPGAERPRNSLTNDARSGR
jgi:DNA-binding MarR family transcriptional regulator